MVYVQDRGGKPLMPTERHGKVRRLLDCGRAEVVCRCPFTIRLAYDTTKHVQRVTLGVDAGSKHIGLSATTKKKELYAAQCDERTDVTELLATRRELRIARRNRTTRYRKSRFYNRRRSEGWLAPSIRCKVDEHLRIVGKVHRILPITKTVVEVAQFDAAKIKNPEIQGEQYQQGEQLSFWNVREYVLARDGHVCQHCHGKSKDKVLNVHHLESRKTGGNAPNNLITLCETCHKAYHRGEFELKVKRGTSLRDAACMNIMRWAVYNALKARYSNVHLTYGYITKDTRIRNGIEKTHNADAYCVSGNIKASRSVELFRHRFVRRHNRQIHKLTILKGGIRKANQAARYVKGFQLFDKVRYNGIECFIAGRRTSGSMYLRDFDGNTVNAGAGWMRIALVSRLRALLTERRTCDSSQR